MSTTYSVNVILGVRVPESQLFIEITKEYEHEHGIPEDARFCPTCGIKRPIFTTHKPIWTDKIDDIFYEPFFGNIRIVKQNSDCFIGFIFNVDCNGNKHYCLSQSEFVPVKQELNTALLKYNLRKYMETFGIYAVPEIS